MWQRTNGCSIDGLSVTIETHYARSGCLRICYLHMVAMVCLGDVVDGCGVSGCDILQFVCS